jgi:isopentenyl diphosphate isomerase/L-lactate dehydrogenase-like FMN-dependent dehydrogenase
MNGGTARDKKANFSHIAPELLAKAAPLGNGTNMTWDFAKRLRDATKMRVLIKGILDPDDARECVKQGFDAVMVSNHGGRNDDAGWSTIRALPDIVAAVNKKVPILIDSGFRRGTDIMKALALGATAVGVGRPYLWGLGAFGQEGVERVLDILRSELTVAVGQAGCASIKDLNPGMIKV